MSEYPRVPVPPEVWAKLAEDNRTPLPILGDMSPWVTQYTVPYWQTDHEEMVLKLERRGRVGEDRWVISDGSHCFNKRTRMWVYEMRPSERDDRFLRDCRFTLAEARPIIVREVFRRHRHTLHRVARIVTLRRMREAEWAKRPQYQLMANALSALQTAREDA